MIPRNMLLCFYTAIDMFGAIKFRHVWLPVSLNEKFRLDYALFFMKNDVPMPFALVVMTFC